MNLAGNLMRDSLDLLILNGLRDGPSYGYALLRLIRAAPGMENFNAGTLYPILHRLEADELITSRWDRSSRRPRKWYHLSTKGQRALREQVGQWNHYVQALRQQLDPLLQPATSNQQVPKTS